MRDSGPALKEEFLEEPARLSQVSINQLELRPPCSGPMGQKSQVGAQKGLSRTGLPPSRCRRTQDSPWHRNQCVPQSPLSLWLSGFPAGSDGKESACNAGDPALISGSGRSPREGNGNLCHCCLENSMDRRVSQATVHGVTKSQT